MNNLRIQVVPLRRPGLRRIRRRRLFVFRLSNKTLVDELSSKFQGQLSIEKIAKALRRRRLNLSVPLSTLSPMMMALKRELNQLILFFLEYKSSFIERFQLIPKCTSIHKHRLQVFEQLYDKNRFRVRKYEGVTQCNYCEDVIEKTSKVFICNFVCDFDVCFNCFKHIKRENNYICAQDIAEENGNIYALNLIHFVNRQSYKFDINQKIVIKNMHLLRNAGITCDKMWNKMNWKLFSRLGVPIHDSDEILRSGFKNWAIKL